MRQRIVNVDGFLHLLQCALQVLRAHTGDTVITGPFVQHMIGRSKTHHAVDHRGATHGLPLVDSNTAVFGGLAAPTGIELVGHFRFVFGEVYAGVIAPRLENDHPLSRLGHLVGKGTTTRATADHDYIGIQGDVPVDVLCFIDHGVTPDTASCGSEKRNALGLPGAVLDGLPPAIVLIPRGAGAAAPRRGFSGPS